MSGYNLDQVFWPPKGWKSWQNIQETYGQALSKNSQEASVVGINYIIQAEPFFGPSRCYNQYKLRFDAWEYTIKNKSRAWSVFELNFTDRTNETKAETDYILDAKALGHRITLNNILSRRAIHLSKYLIRKINTGNVPNVENALKMYHLHPSQYGSFYDRKAEETLDESTKPEDNRYFRA